MTSCSNFGDKQGFKRSQNTQRGSYIFLRQNRTWKKRLYLEKVGKPPIQSILYLPETTEHDIYLDFEGHPFWEIEEGLIFLFGFIEKEENEWEYVAHWAHDKAEEKRQVTALIDYFYKKFQEHPETRIYHYNHTERALLSDITEETDSMSNILSVIRICISK